MGSGPTTGDAAPAALRRFSRRTKLLVAAGAVAGVCGAGALALMPGAGPPLLSALPPGDVLLAVDGADALWRELEGSERLARLRAGEAWAQLAATDFGARLAEGVAQLRRQGLAERARAAHLIGREAGASVTFGPDGRPARWVAAFRIDTVARAAELAAGRLFLGAAISRSTRGGVTVAAFARGAARAWWARLGDLLIVAGDEAQLDASIASARAAEAARGGSRSTSTYGSSWAARFDLEGAPARVDGFRLGLALDRPEEKLAAAGRVPAPAREEIDGTLRALGLPAPVDGLALTVWRADGELREEATIRGALGVPAAGDSVPERRPAGTFAWVQFRPGRDEAIPRAWYALRLLHPPEGTPPHAGWEAFRAMAQARLGPEMAMALATQEAVDPATGGFPAEFFFFKFFGAESLRETFEQILIDRSLGIYAPGEEEPVTYPYLVRHRLHGAWVYEIVIRITRRHDGFRPCLGILGSDLVYASSLPALEAYLAGAGAARSPVGRAWVDALEGARVLVLDWQTPPDLRQLKNAWDYATELRRFAPPATEELLNEGIDYEALWRGAQELLRELALHQRVGVRTAGGMRMRARWVLRD